MNNYYKITVILILILIVYLYFLFKTSKLYYPKLPENFKAKTTDFDKLKKITIDRINSIEKKSTIFTPYNHENMRTCKNAIINSSNYSELVTAFLLTPNNSIDTYPIYPIKNIDDTIIFQFEQGVLGWYWGYAVFPEQNNNFGTVMYYIMRNDLGTKELREKYNLNIGETTVYTISIGVGLGKGQWYFNPEPIICPGTYEVSNKTNFTLECSTDILPKFILKNDNDKLTLEFEYNDKKLNFGSNTIFIKTNKARINGPNGCAPCLSGTGTLYWSYTQLNSSSIIKINDKSYNFKNGDGWLDHQWGRSKLPLKPLHRLSINVINMFKLTGKLGRYVWINLHLPNNIQYMVFCFPNENNMIKVNNTYEAIYNVYSNDKSKLLQKGNITFDYITKYNYDGNEILFPTKIIITVYDMNNNKHIYKIDTDNYGNTITIDLTGNPHWSGGVIIKENNNKIGTGFLELNQFENKEKYLNRTLKIANINSNDYKKEKLSLLKALPSIIILIIPLLLIISIIILIIFGIKN